MQAAIVDIYTGAVSWVGDVTQAPVPAVNQMQLTESQWAAAPLVGQIWNSAIPAAFAAPLPIQSMTPAEFIAALGSNLKTLWASAASNPFVAEYMAQGLTSDTIRRSVAYPAMMQFEQAGLLPTGTTAQVWGS